jgi:hypothetical protein
MIPKPERPESHCSVALYAFNGEHKACKALKKITHQRIMQELRYVGHDAKQGLLRPVVFILISDKLWKFLTLLFLSSRDRILTSFQRVVRRPPLHNFHV